MSLHIFIGAPCKIKRFDSYIPRPVMRIVHQIFSIKNVLLYIIDVFHENNYENEVLYFALNVFFYKKELWWRKY